MLIVKWGLDEIHCYAFKKENTMKKFLRVITVLTLLLVSITFAERAEAQSVQLPPELLYSCSGKSGQDFQKCYDERNWKQIEYQRRAKDAKLTMEDAMACRKAMGYTAECQIGSVLPKDSGHSSENSASNAGVNQFQNDRQKLDAAYHSGQISQSDYLNKLGTLSGSAAAQQAALEGNSSRTYPGTGSDNGGTVLYGTSDSEGSSPESRIKDLDDQFARGEISHSDYNYALQDEYDHIADDGYGAGDDISGPGMGTGSSYGTIAGGGIGGGIGTGLGTDNAGPGLRISQEDAKKWTKGIEQLVNTQAQTAAQNPGNLAGAGGGSLFGGLGGGALGSLGNIPGFNKAQSLLGDANSLLNNKYVGKVAGAAGLDLSSFKSGLGQASGTLNMASGLAAGQASDFASKASSIGGGLTSLASAKASLGNLNLGNPSGIVAQVQQGAAAAQTTIVKFTGGKLPGP